MNANICKKIKVSFLWVPSEKCLLPVTDFQPLTVAQVAQGISDKDIMSRKS
jgi:hypothetical protein